MPATLLLVGDINLMNVADSALPFRRAQSAFAEADAVFGNLECLLYHPPGGHSVEQEGFFADPAVGGEALRLAGLAAVGLANNVNYGTAAILGSIAQLDRLSIGHTGAGPNLASARAPAIVERAGRRIGFVQRSSVYWPTNHEAGESSTGIAALRAHTAYQVPAQKTRAEIPPMNRPGIPPIVVTWPDRAYLGQFTGDIAALRQTADIVVASCHWGLGEEVLDYMTEIAHAAVDAGADVVIGHGPHYSLPVEVYKGKPVFYGLGSFSFHTGHGGRRHGDWIGMMARVEFDAGCVSEASFRFVRHNDANETVICPPSGETETLMRLTDRASRTGTRLQPEGDEVRVLLN
jgi:poly-gamma-glutamate capsule biosynthesis protein CapA/YwtB (metallophosphatase superfamily)